MKAEPLEYCHSMVPPTTIKLCHNQAHQTCGVASHSKNDQAPVFSMATIEYNSRNGNSSETAIDISSYSSQSIAEK